MNLRVRMVTGWSAFEGVAMVVTICSGDGEDVKFACRRKCLVGEVMINAVVTTAKVRENLGKPSKNWKLSRGPTLFRITAYNLKALISTRSWKKSTRTTVEASKENFRSTPHFFKIVHVASDMSLNPHGWTALEHLPAMDPSLVQFHRQYMQQVQNPTYPPGKYLVDPNVQNQLYKHFFDGPLRGPHMYQRKVLKQIISLIEGAINDADEEVGLSLNYFPYLYEAQP